MVDDVTRTRVRALLDAIRDHPTSLPLGEVAMLAGGPMRISIDASGSDAIVYASGRSDPVFDRLSRRESEVAELVADGLTNRQIAAALFISLPTVKDHVHSVLVKTGLPSRSAVAARWHRPGPVPNG